MCFLTPEQLAVCFLITVSERLRMKKRFLLIKMETKEVTLQIVLKLHSDQFKPKSYLKLNTGVVLVVWFFHGVLEMGRFHAPSNLSLGHTATRGKRHSKRRKQWWRIVQVIFQIRSKARSPEIIKGQFLSISTFVDKLVHNSVQFSSVQLIRRRIHVRPFPFTSKGKTLPEWARRATSAVVKRIR